MTAEQVSAADASREDFFGNGDVGRVDASALMSGQVSSAWSRYS